MGAFSPFGVDLFGEPVTVPNRSPLAARFEFPPFSVLDARSGEWQERKRAWLALGIRGELGRGIVNLNMAHPETTSTLDFYAQKRGLEKERGRDLSKDEAAEIMAALGTLKNARAANHASPGGSARPACDYRNGQRGDGAGRPGDDDTSGTSVFDPVLSELIARWFCPPGGQIVDPFAGGSVRGIVAALLGFRYWGCDLRPEQIAANEAQRAAICPDEAGRIVWTCGDARDVLGSAPLADLVFTCPPYGDLERYSDDPRDLSTLAYPDFLVAYRQIIKAAAWRLLSHHFAVLVVGDFRDPRTGHYRGFVADTIQAGRDAGLALYNDAVLVTAVGSLPIRVGKQFEAGRKLGKTHQNVLVFVKRA